MKLDVHFDEPNYFHFKTVNGLGGWGEILEHPHFQVEKLKPREAVDITPIIL